MTPTFSSFVASAFLDAFFTLSGDNFVSTALFSGFLRDFLVVCLGASFSCFLILAFCNDSPGIIFLLGILFSAILIDILLGTNGGEG